MTLYGATILRQSGPGSDGNEEILHTPLLEPHHQIV